MRIEINHRPVHQNFRKRKILEQGKQSGVKSLNKVLGPLKSKYQQDQASKRAERSPNSIVIKQTQSPAIKNFNKSLLKNQLRHSGGPSDREERFDETVKSDEFLNNQLYTNTVKNMDNVVSSNGNLLVPPYNDGSFNAIHNDQFIKTTTSYMPGESLLK